MRVSTDLQHFALHDGGVRQITYRPQTRQLEFEVELSEESSAEVGWFGTLVFLDVLIARSEPSLAGIDWEQVARTNISVAAHHRDLDRDGREGVQWAIQMFYLDTSHHEEWLILEFSAREFTWYPDRTKPSPYSDQNIRNQMADL